MKPRFKSDFNSINKLSFYTLIALYLLILAGGIVRSTGSGMGCPDWPKCFGKWVPPTDAESLPENYQEIYSEFRQKKNLKFSTLLVSLGFEKTAEHITSDQSILEEKEFNTFNTWVEYINRLWGAITGLFILALVGVSLKYWSSKRSFFYLSLAVLIITGFQGWLGSIVVSTNLLSFLVSMHMFIAFIIVGLVLYIYIKSSPSSSDSRRDTKTGLLNFIGFSAVSIFLLQVFYGVELREMIDSVASSLGYSDRHSWVSKAGFDFIIHRSFSWLVLLSSVTFVYMIIKNFKGYRVLFISSMSLLGLIIFEMVTGVILAYSGFPAFVQPIHLLVASLIFSNQLLLLFQINQSEVKEVFKFA
ncbi:MAG: COX15/CtaA family protein [Bacteroidota bacterium]